MTMESVISHTCDEHINRVNLMCRLCCQRVKRAEKDKDKNLRLCSQYCVDIFDVYGIKTEQDIEGKHPKTICQKCYAKLMRLKREKKSVEKNVQPDFINSVWCAFDSELDLEQCRSCRLFEQQKTAGRPKKRIISQTHTSDTSQGSHSFLSIDSSFSDIITSTPAKSRKTCALQTSPHLIRSPHINTSTDTASSPIQLRPRPSHTDTASSPFKRPLRSFHELSAPLTKEEEYYFTKIARIKLSQSKDKTTIKCKTGGQPIVLTKTVVPRKSSGKAATPLRRKRARMLSKMRKHLSGQTEQDVIKQQGTELKTTSGARKRLILREGGCGEVNISATQGTAIRSQLGLSLYTYRQYKQILRKYGVKFASEKKETRQQVKARCGKVKVAMRSLNFFHEMQQKEELVQTPVASIEDISDYVTKLLDEHERQGNLTWHDGAIPEDEIWLKIGADHGGGSFKIMLQIANLVNANSKLHTCILAMAECKDSPENMRRLFDPLKDDISDLQTMTWHGKSTRLFLFGDYDFLTKSFGLSGAQGVHPCLFCTASKTDIHMPPQFTENNFTQRSLCQIKRDYSKYKHAGKQKSNAKMFNNVIRKPILDIELEQVVPPYLHILLGVVKKHHDLLEADCHSLDKEIAKKSSKHSLRSTAFKHIRCISTTCETFENVGEEKTTSSFPSDSPENLSICPN